LPNVASPVWFPSFSFSTVRTELYDQFRAEKNATEISVARKDGRNHGISQFQGEKSFRRKGSRVSQYQVCSLK
jgi:hypothetical protein